MNIPASLFAYLCLFEIFVWSCDRIFHPGVHDKTAWHLKTDARIAQDSLKKRLSYHAACAACSAGHTLLEQSFLHRFTYHGIALSLLSFCTVLVLIFFRDYFFYGLFLSMQMGILFPCIAFPLSNLASATGLGDPAFILSQVLFTPLLLAACFIWIRSCCRNISFEISLPGSYYTLMYLFSVIEYYCLIKLDDLLTLNDLVTGVNVLIQVGMLILYLIVIRFMFSMCVSYQTSLRDQATQQQLELMRKNLEENQAMYAQMRTLRHELKNHMFYMDYLIDQKDYEGLHQYFTDFYQKEYKDYNYWDTSSTLVGTLLNQKVQLAAGKEIELKIRSTLPEDTGISEVDLCAILSNLLDNAIENCSRTQQENAVSPDKPVIHADLSLKKEYLSIEISNPVSENVLEKNPSLTTTKKDPGVHGIGMHVVRQIIKKYEGLEDISVENGEFIVKILLPQHRG